MSETRSHQFEKDVVYATGDSKYIIGKRVKAGETIRLYHLAGKFEYCATSEYIELGYWNGHAYKPLYRATPPTIGDLVHWNGEVVLREGQYPYVYCNDVSNGEKMTIQAEGEYE